MFVDKKLHGVKAVQTLSRLNRTIQGKKDTFILDFVNTEEEILDVFQTFFEATTLKEKVNLNLIYDTQSKLRKFALYNDDDIVEDTQYEFRVTLRNFGKWYNYVALTRSYI